MFHLGGCGRWLWGLGGFGRWRWGLGGFGRWRWGLGGFGRWLWTDMLAFGAMPPTAAVTASLRAGVLAAMPMRMATGICANIK